MLRHPYSKYLSLLLPLLAVTLGACSGSNESERASAGQGNEETVAETPAASSEVAQEAKPITIASAERHVACGCSIEGVGHCGNYIEIDGKFVAVANWKDLGLGAMEWCGKDNVFAESAGELRGDEFHATTLAVHQR